MKTIRFKVFLFAGSMVVLSSSVWSQVPLVLKLPPTSTNVIAQGMGGAMGADGTLFNAASLNPALLGRSPHSVEIFGPGLSLSNNLSGVFNYLQNLSLQADQVYDELNNGLNTGNTAEINTGLGQVQNLITQLTNQSLQGGAGVNAAVRFDNHWGVEVYSNLHAFSELWPGNLTMVGISFPFNPNNPNSSAAVTNAVEAMSGDLQQGINQALTPAEQSAVQTDINSLKSGQETIQTFVTHVSGTLSGVDPNALKQALLKSLANDLVTLSALVYWDTVIMGTYSFKPFGDIRGLTVGANLKIVNRHFSYGAFTPADSQAGQAFLNNFNKSSTRWGVDLGFLYEAEGVPLDFGLGVEDFIHQDATVTGSAGSLAGPFVTDPAPTVVRVGASWHPLPGLRVDSDLDDLFSTTTFYSGTNAASRIKLGAGYRLLSFLQLRAGFGNQALSGGVGLATGVFGLDYSYAADDLSQSYNHSAQMSFVF